MPQRLRRGLHVRVAAGFVILSAGREAPGVEGSPELRTLAAATTLPDRAARAARPGLRSWSPVAPASTLVPQARPDLRRLVQVSCGWPRVGRALDLRTLMGGLGDPTAPVGRRAGGATGGMTLFFAFGGKNFNLCDSQKT